MNEQNSGEEVIKKIHISLFSRNIIDLNDLYIILKPSYNHGRCGGYNLGNTCFMNSSIACLSNCIELTTYFLTKKYKEDINKNNKEGLGGKLANAWYELLQEYWMTQTTTGNPSNVKAQVAKKVKKFSGFNQQDSNEFITEFLSILSEDLNKNDTKKYVELKEKGEKESDLECAIRFWKVYLERNDSIITDIFSGLLKSELICNNCGFNNITFDPFNTLTLPIPSDSKILKNKPYEDIKLFYIPKYCIKPNVRIRLRIKKECPLKEVIEQIKKLNNFNHNLEKIKYVQVLEGKFIRFIDENEYKKENEFVFIFDDDSKEGENNKIIPLYMNKNNKNSAFPRLLFLKDNMNFGDLKKKIYYFARNFFIGAFNNERKNEKCELDQEIEKYKEAKKDDNYNENTLFELYDKEYDDIFNIKEESNNKEKVGKFLNDFPYNIIIKKKFEDDENENIVIFDGKNNLDNLKEFQISKDEDPINTLLEKIESEECFLYLVLKPNTIYSIPKIKIDSCENADGPDYKKQETLTLDDLFDFFCSDEYLDNDNEWTCLKCKNKVKAKKNFSLYFLPRILIICLKRFSREQSYFGDYSKNNELINFPLENLDLGKYVCGPDKNYSKYDLFAVSQHFGGTGGGHYTAVCKNYDGKWYDYNDSSCSLSSPERVVSSSAYVLFYRKQNW